MCIRSFSFGYVYKLGMCLDIFSNYLRYVENCVSLTRSNVLALHQITIGTDNLISFLNILKLTGTFDLWRK